MSHQLFAQCAGLLVVNPCHCVRHNSRHGVLCSCSFEDSLSEPADPDTAPSLAAAQRPSPVLGPSRAGQAETEAQQAKHAGMGGGRVPTGPPQQSRCKWQLKGSAQVMSALLLGCLLQRHWADRHLGLRLN